MPKIPTFEAQGRPTAEVGSVKTSFQVPVTNDIFTKAQSVVANYYIKEKEEEAKLKAIDYENKALPKLYEVYDKYKNNPFPTDAADGFQKEGKQVIDDFMNENLSNENKFVQRAVSTKLGANLTQLNLATIKSSRDAMEKNSERVDKDWDSGLVSKMGTIPGFIESGQAYNESAEYINNKYAGDPFTKKIKLDEKFKIIDTFAMVKDSKEPISFLQKIKEDPSAYKNADLNLKSQLILQAQENFIKLEKVKINSDAVLQRNGFLLDEKEKNEAMDYLYSTNKYSDANIAELSIQNGGVVDQHKKLLSVGFSNAALTGNPAAVGASINLYRNYRSQGALPYLKNSMKLTEDQMDFYDTALFLTDTMGETVPNAVAAYNQYYKNKNSTEVKSRFIDSKKIQSTAKNLTSSTFGTDAKNLSQVEDLVAKYANTLYKIYPADQDKILESVEKKISENFRVDIFDNLVPIKKYRPEIHDVSVKSYIKMLYDSGRINKDQHDFDDLIAVDVESMGRFDVSGIQIINRKNPVSVVIFNPAQSDFDKNEFSRGVITDKQLIENVYPLARDQRYQDFIFSLRARKEILTDPDTALNQYIIK
jgi:hypothetical protein